ncbi:antitoxin Xre/MbcA/ParS toxin-binding domain-containing protein [Sphingosinicella humi]|uniref:Antitoxin Xre/MbcA/ParS-like toxin-binding domain-containing protein n=1 Tax=Allosphingosinicella humi TaxID=2068657 RepID=A0A2U2J045_9SPHN|nr:antitoxin Xre/MbcA/ParS toxin-binding domain-containing protein [Sphingosinicella humi]PWG01687.1 hypothetical protein DF286_01485 [Sphingosinicella humi]
MTQNGRLLMFRYRRILFRFHPTPASAISKEMEDMTADAAAILALVEPRFGSVERARHWFEKEPLPGFSGRTAEQLVMAGRTAEVRDLLAAVDAGIHW